MIYSISQSKKTVGILLTLATLFGFVVLPTTVLATVGDACFSALHCGSGETCADPGTDPKVKAGKCEADTFGLNPVGNQVAGKLGNQDLRETAANLINVLLGVLGLIAVVIVLAGGFKWMTAGGNDEKVTEARKMIFSGIIGLAIIMSAWAISLFVINQLATATGGDKTGIPDQG